MHACADRFDVNRKNRSRNLNSVLHGPSKNDTMLFGDGRIDSFNAFPALSSLFLRTKAQLTQRRKSGARTALISSNFIVFKKNQIFSWGANPRTPPPKNLGTCNNINYLVPVLMICPPPSMKNPGLFSVMWASDHNEQELCNPKLLYIMM